MTPPTSAAPTAPMSSGAFARVRLPWYGFLYRLFGAQGTFWLWIVCIVAVWWTALPAFQRLANRSPKEGRTPADLGNLGATDTTRWVVTTGVLVRLDRALLLLDDERPPALPPVPLLFDGADNAAAWWKESRAVADLYAATADRTPEHDAAFQRLQARCLELETDATKLVPAPRSCLLIQDSEPLPLSPPQRQHDVGVDPFKIQIEKVITWGKLVRERVEPDVPVKGVLVETPHSYVDRFSAELGAEVAPMMLQRDRQPRETESIVFAGALITLLFLAAGFRGATLVKTEDAPAKS